MAIWNSEQAVILIVEIWLTVQMGLFFRSSLKRAKIRRRR
jgi:hypothetical protein